MTAIRRSSVRVGKYLLTIVAVCAAIGVFSVAAMAALVFDELVLLAYGAAPLAFMVVMLLSQSLRRVLRRRVDPRVALRQQVGDPATLTGRWRTMLATAWRARDEFVAAAARRGDSPLHERLTDHNATVDVGLQRCGELAHHGQHLDIQMRALRVRRLRAQLLVEQRRQPTGPRAVALAQRIHDATALVAEVRAVQTALEAQVHRLQTAAWRATSLSGAELLPGDDADAVDDLLDDLEHLRVALAEVEDVERVMHRPAAAAR